MVIDGGAGLGLLTRTIRDTVHRAPDELAPWAQQLSDRLDRLTEVTALLWWDNHPETALANATVYLEAAGHVVLAWIWLDQVIAAHGREGAFYDGKRAAARYFFTYELPKVDAQFDLLSTRDMQLVELNPACL